MRPSATAVPGASNALVGSSPDVFRNIRNPKINLCIWRRSGLKGVQSEVAAISDPRLDLRSRVLPRTFERNVRALLVDAGFDTGAYEGWIADMSALASFFFGLSEGRDVKVRLETTADDACRRYHMDRSHLRMLCTYRGVGTQWLADTQVDRAALDARADNERIARDGEPMQMEPSWVGLFKGSLYPDPGAGGLVHRSPPIAGTGQFRVRFCLDC